MALAIQPDSADARYNFALALKAAGYAVDAVNELKKILRRRIPTKSARSLRSAIFTRSSCATRRARGRII